MALATEEGTRLQIRRVLRAPVTAVYAAWTDPQQVSQWMAPSDDFGPTEATMDVRVGGIYEEVVPNRRLVYSWAWESTPERQSRVTVELHPAGDSTELVITHDRFLDAEARDKHDHGWQGCLARFERYVSR